MINNGEISTRGLKLNDVGTKPESSIDYNPANNLTPKQDILIATILNYGAEISKSHGYGALSYEMKKAKEQDEQNNNTPNISQGRKNYGAAL